MKTLNYPKLIYLQLFFTFTASFTYSQTQKGNDINGEAQDDYSSGVSMPDANTVAIGAGFNDGNGIEAGHVRVYSWSGSAWVQKGLDIDGEAANDHSGSRVSMPDENTVAIGASYNAGNGNLSGHVRIFAWSGSAWVQKGTDIDGEAADDFSGGSVVMPDPNTVAIGASANDGNGNNSGHVRVYTWNGSDWVQKGSDINGEAAQDNSGHSISMPDANTIAIGAPGNDNTFLESGHVRIYTWSGSTWIQKGADINGEHMGDQSGTSVSMPDASTVAIGAPYNQGGGSPNSGQTRIYSWSGSSWIQKGGDIDGLDDYDLFGSNVSMPSENVLAVSAPFRDSYTGSVGIFTWSGSAWTPWCPNINGEAMDDYSGSSISMPNENTVAIGASQNDGSVSDAGHVRIYTLGDLGLLENEFISQKSIYPNPFTEIISIDLGKAFSELTIQVRNSLGQEVNQRTFTNIAELELSIPGEAGVYFIEVISDKSVNVLRVVKNN